MSDFKTPGGPIFGDTIDGGPVKFELIGPEDKIEEPEKVEPTKEEVEEVVEEVTLETINVKTDETLIDLSVDKKEEVLETKVQTSLDYNSVAESLFGEKYLSETEIEDENGEFVSLSDIEIDEEVLKDLLSKKIEEVEQKYEGTVSTNDFSEMTQRMIEIEKAGGDPQQAFEDYNKVDAVVNSIDISTEEGQIQMVYEKLVKSNVKKNDALRLIQIYQNEGVLESEAIQAKEELKEASQDLHNKKVEQAKQQKLDSQKREKEYLSSIRSTLKKSGISKDSVIKKHTDLLKKDENGTPPIHHVYLEYLKEPEKAIDLINYLTDPEAFKKSLVQDQLNKEKTKEALNRRILRKRSAGGSEKREDDKKTIKKGVIGLTINE